MNNYNDISIIEDFLDKKLSGEEVLHFAEQLKTNVELQQHVEDIQLIKNALYDYELGALKGKMQQDLQNYKEPFKWKWWFVFSFALVTSTGLFLLLHDNNPPKPSVERSLPENNHTIITPEKEKTPDVSTPHSTSVKPIKEIEFTSSTPEKKSTPNSILADTLTIIEPEISVSEKMKRVPLPKEPSKENKKEKDVVVDEACSTLRQNLSLAVLPTCYNQNTGEIKLNNDLWLFGLEKNTLTRKNSFASLSEGTYTVYMKNDNDCFDSIAVNVTGVPCELLPEYVFDYSLNEHLWKLPSTDFPSATYQIRSLDGRFSYEFKVDSHFPTEVDLYTINGERLPKGYYIVLITPEKKMAVKSSLRIL